MISALLQLCQGLCGAKPGHYEEERRGSILCDLLKGKQVTRSEISILRVRERKENTDWMCLEQTQASNHRCYFDLCATGLF